MIRYMSVERLDFTQSRNGKKVYNLPFPIESFENFKDSNIPPYKKLLILAEQYILAKSIDDLTYQSSNEISDFLTTIKNQAQSSLITMQKDIDQELYSHYKGGVEALLRDFIITPALVDLFENTYYYPENERILPKNFYKPFLGIAVNEYKNAQYIYSDAILLYPERKDDIVVFHSKSGKCFYKKNIPSKSLNRQLNYLLHFDWNETNWLSLMGVLSSFCIDPVQKLQSNRSIPHFLKSVMTQTTSPLVNYNGVKYDFLNLIKDNIQNIEKTPYVESLAYYLEKLNYSEEIVSALTKNNPTGKDIMYLSDNGELGFIKNMILLRATEAADDLDQTDDDTEEDNEDTNTDDSLDTDIDSPDNMDEDLGDTSSDESGDDFGDMDMGDDTFGDDTGGGSSGDDSIPEPKENAVDVPNDPYSLALNIATSETLDEFLIRNESISLINSIILDPPATMTAEDLKFLKIWVTQWINFVPIETTKNLLSKLSVYLGDQSDH